MMPDPLTFNDYLEALSQFSYKPGWFFSLYHHGDEGIGVQIIIDLPNAYRPMTATTLDIKSVIPLCYNRDDFFRWLHWRVGRIELHERSEWFKVRGKPFMDPHSEEYTDAIQVR